MRTLREFILVFSYTVWLRLLLRRHVIKFGAAARTYGIADAYDVIADWAYSRFLLAEDLRVQILFD
ncbi:TPA: hypothetical protein HA259_08065 [Thermoplasmata archaeon]|nr:hypothetical protein [Thermoplasmata archaeon]